MDEGRRMKEIPSHPGYFITESGEVFSDRAWPRRKLKAWMASNGYPRLTLMRDGKIITRSVHSLVAETFIGPRGNQVVRHLDGNPHNCHLSNLAYGTHKDNEADKAKHGHRLFGSRVHGARLTDEGVLRLRAEFLRGVGLRELTESTGMDYSAVFSAVHGETWSHLPVPDYSVRVPLIPVSSWNRGEGSGNAKLTAIDVDQIVSMLRKGMGTDEIADEFDVSRSAIGHIAAGRTWSHQTGIRRKEKAAA